MKDLIPYMIFLFLHLFVPNLPRVAQYFRAYITTVSSTLKLNNGVGQIIKPMYALSILINSRIREQDVYHNSQIYKWFHKLDT